MDGEQNEEAEPLPSSGRGFRKWEQQPEEHPRHRRRRRRERSQEGAGGGDGEMGDRRC